MNDIIKTINDFLKKHSWCDFEVIEWQGNFDIGGKTGFDPDFSIVIRFNNVLSIFCRWEWEVDTKQDAFFILDNESEHISQEARDININYGVESGYHIFKIISENYPKPFYIIAESIEIIKVNY